MARILCIETSTKVCSVALSENGRITELKEDLSNNYSHAERINVFIDAVLKPTKFSDLDAVAVSLGPGSYTGLRIGVSSAKGICIGQNLPLISVNPLEAMARRIEADEKTLKIPMIDARRMEVFCAGFKGKGEPVFDTRAEIVTADSFSRYKNFSDVLYFGDGAEKCKNVLHEPRYRFAEVYASALGMAEIADEKFHKKKYENLAYFEPFYLKDFVAGKPKKRLP